MRQQSPLRSHYRAAHHYCLLFVALIVTLLGAAPAFSLPGDFAQPPGSMSFLPAHLAFKPTATALSSEQVEIHFDIQPGYYLYRSKLAVEATGLVPADVRVNAGELPPGVQKDDPNFGPT